MVATVPPRRLATIKQTALIYPAFKPSSIRSFVSQQHTNGFKPVVRRIGRRILLDLDEFEKWIDTYSS